ncbi:hypothetical protein Q0P93_12410, partial [Staphylococcus aureus]|nr:hypothetical protein [Staphylococcus aureus]
MFISLAIWSINSMGNKQCISLNLLLSDDTFAVISVMTTLGTAILGGIAPSIYGIFTSPIDKKSSFRAISDWEQEQRNNVKDLMMLLPFTLLSILIVIFKSSPDSCVKCYTMFLPFLLIKIDVF